ncbi:MAG: protein O-mannosyl-transferase [Blastocatellia bacterium]
MPESLSLTDAVGSPLDLSTDDAAASVKPSPLSRDAAPATVRDLASKPVLMLGLLLLVTLAFANSINGELVHDDTAQIANNQMFGHWDGATLGRVLTRDYWAALQPEVAGDELASLYYRPAFSLFLMAGYEIVGRRPAGWHLIVLLLHMLCALLAFVTLEKTLQAASALADRPRRLLAACAAAVFAIHPAQSESVAWIAGAVGLMSTALMLATFYCYLHYREQRRAAILATMMLLFALAMLTKESAIVLILIVAAHELFIFNGDARGPVRLRRAALVALPFALIGAIYMVLRHLALGVWMGRIANLNFPDDAALTFADTLRTLPALFIAYVKLIVFPLGLSEFYDFGYVRALGWATFWMPLAALLFACLILLRAAARNMTTRLGLIWFALPLLPHLNTRAFVSDEIIHDRYLYLSLLGVGILVGGLLVQGAGKLKWFSPRFAAVVAVGLLATLTLLTVMTNRRFANSETLWTHTAAHAPRARVPLIALGVSAEGRGDYATALNTYERVLAIHPDILDALNNSAFVYARQGRWDEATRRFERVIELQPGKAGGHFNLSFAYAVQRRYAEAVKEQQRAIELDPHNARIGEWRARLAELQRRLADDVGRK